MRIVVSCIFVALSFLVSAQNKNLSGDWVGKVLEDNVAHKMVLKLTLIDECNITYRVEQIEYPPHANHCKYNFLQTGNILIRDGISYYESFDKDGGGSLAHLRLEYDGKFTIEGVRTDHSGPDDKFILTCYKTFPTLASCDEELQPQKPKIIYIKEKPDLKLPCSVHNKKPVFVDTVDVNEYSTISLKLEDNKVEDNDHVSLFIGRAKLLENVPLFYGHPYVLPVYVTQDTLVSWCACNQGVSGPNTGLFTLHINDNIKDRKINVYLKKDERAAFYLRVKKIIISTTVVEE